MAVGNGSAVMAAPSSAVDPVVAEAMAMSARLVPLKNALGIADLTDQEMDLFAMVALRMRLDPFAKQIYAIKRNGKVTFQTGIDGFRSSAEETDQYRGSDEPVFGPWVATPYGHPEYATVVVHRELPDGARISQSATAYWDEFVVTGNQGFQWQKMPRVMLAKCAEAAAFRKAFPKRFGQVYVAEEMLQADAAEQATPVVALTARDRIAAERAALQAQTTSAAPVAPAAAPRPVQAAPASGGIAPAAAAAPTPAPEADAAADGAGDAVTEDGEIIEGVAVEISGDGINAGELRQWLRDHRITIPAALEHAMRLFGKDSIDGMSDAQRAALRDELDAGAAR